MLDAMDENLKKIVDVTIYYPEGIPTFGDFLCGRVKRVQVEVHTTEITNDLKGDFCLSCFS